VFTAYRWRRYGQEALTGVMQWAQQVQGVDRFVASVSPANLPSLNLISKFGFQKVGEAIDPVDGIEHIYLRDATRRTAAASRRSS
jgi:ribosomal-protein-alanine N-acetyltransferase